MIKLLLGLVVALFASVGCALLLREDPGYVLISVGDFTVETSVVAAVVILVIIFVLLYIAFRALGWLLSMPRQTRITNRRRQRRNAQRDLARGMKELAEERWAAAEVTLTRSAAQSESSALHYVGAARAAHQLGAQWRRDDYMHRAEDAPEHESLVVGLAQAEFLLDEDKPAEAKQVLLPLYHANRRQPRVLKLLARCYTALGEWASLKEILPRIEKAQALDEPQFRALQFTTYKGLLDNASRSGKLEDLRAIWHEVPHPVRYDDTLLIEQAGHLRDNNAVDEADALFRDALRHRWSDKLVVGYSELGRGNVAEQLSVAEGWLKEHEHDPYLLLALGKLARRGRQLGKARTYLEESVKLLPNPDTYYELGGVLDELDDKESADRCYRAGLTMLSGQPEEKTDVEVLPSTGSKEMVLTKDEQSASGVS